MVNYSITPSKDCSQLARHLNDSQNPLWKGEDTAQACDIASDFITQPKAIEYGTSSGVVGNSQILLLARAGLCCLLG